jgi:hypothetical protein
MKTTIADVFIETLDPNDEGEGRFEGIFLSHALQLDGKNPIYTRAGVSSDMRTRAQRRRLQVEDVGTKRNGREAQRSQGQVCLSDTNSAI